MARLHVGENKAFIQLHLSVFLAGFTGLFGKLITLNEVDIVWYRMFFTSLILMVFTGLPRVGWKKFLQIAGCGALLGLHWMLFYCSIRASNVSIGVVCFALVGFFTAIIEPIIGRHRPSWRELLLSLLTVCGIMLIFGFDVRYRAGIAVGCRSSLLDAFFSVLSKRVQATTGRASSTMLLYELTGGGIVLAIAALAYSVAVPQAVVVPQSHDLIALLGNSLLQNVIRNFLRQRYNSSSGLVADFGLGHAVKGFQRLFCVHLAMPAHHAFDFQCLFHVFRLLLGC